ncbi:MAG: glutaredoxin [Nitrospira sp.]|nr:glutaredoxin [Nitrospira sp.]
MALTFYHVAWCPDCIAVREKLAALKLAYEDVVVPDARMFRKQVYDVSGQYYVPVVKDGDFVLTETDEILAYLDERYGAGGAQAPRPAAATSQADRKPETLSEDDRYPSCRRPS